MLTTTADCNGQKRSGAVSLKYVLPATAKDDVLFYSASPLSVAVLQGLLANDVNPASCVAKGAALTVARITPAASGTATVRNLMHCSNVAKLLNATTNYGIYKPL